jgi:hypothetical protein
MLFQTHQLIQNAWEGLREHRQINDFKDRGELEEACSELGQVEGAGQSSYLCRIRTDEAFCEGNLRIVDTDEEPWSLVTHPAFAGGLQEDFNHDQ